MHVSFFWSKYRKSFQSIPTIKTTVSGECRRHFLSVVLMSASAQYIAMSEAGLIHRRRRPHVITKVDKLFRIKKLLKRDFTATAPLKKLLTDITEIQCADGKLYVLPILDWFNGEIIALEMHDNMKKELCIDTVKQLRDKYGRLEGTILHSNSGCQYTSYAFRRILISSGLIQSLSSTAHRYDNARMESFFATLKKEKLYQLPTYKMKREEVKTVIFRYNFGYNIHKGSTASTKVVYHLWH